MPDTITPVHYLIAVHEAGPEHACHGLGSRGTTESGRVTCFACRRSEAFKAAQLGVGAPTPLPQRKTPVLLKEIIASNEQLQRMFLDSLAETVKQGLNSGSNDAEHEALTDLADALGLTYDDTTDTYI